MGGVIGQASEFYRLRLAHVDEPDGVDFEWRDDILYRDPPPATIRETESWVVEAVELDNEDTAHTVGRFQSRNEAQDAIEEAEEALGEMTRSQFEGRYIKNTSTPGST